MTGDGPSRTERIERLLDRYFDMKTETLVTRVLATASRDELHDDDAMDALVDEFTARLEDRYDRDDPGWHEAAAAFLRAEFDRQITQARQRDRALEEQLADE